jgi:hypothetical protein
MPHLLAVISGHGYGHAMQTCLVLNALRRQMPHLRLSVYTAVDQAFLATRLHGDYNLIAAEVDFGMIMHSAVDVDAAASGRAYAAYHAQWLQRLHCESAKLRQIAPDAVLSNIAYLPLAAAAAAGIKSAALCSLNWADIYHHYCADFSGAEEIEYTMRRAYRSADIFLQPRPHMPMSDMPHAYSIAPLAQRGQRRDLHQQLRQPAHMRFVIIGLGGISMPLPLQEWPHDDNICWLIPDNWSVQRPDVFKFSDLGATFIDLLASADALITKPGYGSFCEAACNGIPVLYLSRPDWPETPFLTAWLQRHNRCAQISRMQLLQGQVRPILEDLIHAPAPALPTVDGADQAAHILAEWML